MPTLKLYEEDPFLTEMEATIVSRAPRGNGEEVVLDRTVFFATSGGQPHDQGVLGGVRVVDVAAHGDEVVHTLEHPLPAEFVAGQRVHGSIDVSRRLDHMRQHHGQHLLSAAFANGPRPIETTAVHFGAETSTLDLARPASDEEIAAALALANRVVLEDRAVTVHRVARGELGKWNLRREPGVEAEVLRIVEVEGFDATPCSGTHPRRTGQVGPIALVGSPEKVRQGLRLTFLCGERVLTDHREKDAAVSTMARAFSVAPPQLSAAVEKLRASERDLRTRLQTLEETLARHEARERVGATPGPGPVSALVPGAPSDEFLGRLAAEITALGRAAVLAAEREGRAFLVVATPRSSGLDAAAALRAGLVPLEGRGGGNANYARGSGPKPAGLAASLAAAAAILAATSPGASHRE